MGYTLLIAEKPDAMRKIAESLAEGEKLKKYVTDQGVDYYEFVRNKKKHLIVAAVGHLFNLSPVGRGEWAYPVFDAEWRPSFETRKQSSFSKRYFDTIKDVAGDASDFIVCCDYDTEGSLIGANILKFLCDAKDAKRMKFSTLTKEELTASYDGMSNHLDIGQIEAGLTRHWLDWLWGLNLTRALTLAMKNKAERGFKVLSTGRVQGPTLALLLERELGIRRFVSKPYWQLELHCKVDGNEIVAMHKKGEFWNKEEADKVLADCKGKDVMVKDIIKKQYKQPPPYPFNTTDLQSEAYSQFKFSPSQTLDLAEGLYQMGAISYPRTSSQKLPVSIGYGKTLRALSSVEHYSDLCDYLLKMGKLIPNEGLKEDPAHPAIYPTPEVPDLRRLTAQQRKVYDLEVRRFMASFADPAIRESMNVILAVGDNDFIATGRRSISLGWARFYSPYTTFEEQVLPEIRIGQRLENMGVEMMEKRTEPPDRYSQGSIVKEMEKRGLGTRATRAEILQTLYERNYISGKSIKVTKLGETVIDVLRDFCPRIISEELTRNFEEEMELVMLGEKRREELVEEAVDVLLEALNEIRKNEDDMGEALLKGLIDSRRDERRLGVCPRCKGELRIIRSRKSGKVFAGCSSYPNCNNSYPLPQNSKIVALDRVCRECLTSIIQIFRKGKRPFSMCLDPKCPTKSNFTKRGAGIKKA
ncbi:MAG: DNA topoisomerase I [Nitrososphaerales archaeon]|nr:DNA topoisomerase I [Nitrososphaerales archaeon]